MVRLPIRGRRWLLVLALAALAGCSAHDTRREPPHDDAPAAVEVARTECESYASAFASCLRSVGTPTEEASTRSGQTRESFLARLHDEPASAVDVAAQCRANRTRLEAQCR